MAVVQEITLGDKEYKRLYEEQRDKINYLERFIGDSTVEQIKRDQDKIEKLKTERDTYKGQAEEADKRVNEIKKAYEVAKINLEKQIRAEKEKQLIDFKKNTNSKKIKPLESKISELELELNSIKEKLNQAKIDKDIADKRVVEVETLLKSRDEEIERLKTIENKVDSLTELVSSKLESILDIVSNNGSREDIVEAVEKVSESIGKKVSTQSIEDECRLIHSLLEQGKTQKEIAAILYPDLARREVKVTDRIKSKTYKKLFNNI